MRNTRFNNYQIFSNSNKDYYVFNLKSIELVPNILYGKDKIDFLIDIILEHFLQINPLKQKILDVKTMLNNKLYCTITKEEKLKLISNVLIILKSLRFKILDSIIQYLIKYIEPIDLEFIQYVNYNRDKYTNLTIRECFIKKRNNNIEIKQNLMLEDINNKQGYEEINEFLNRNLWEVLHEEIEDKIIEKIKIIFGKKL